jgi:hypothetical protein
MFESFYPGPPLALPTHAHPKIAGVSGAASVGIQQGDDQGGSDYWRSVNGT